METLIALAVVALLIALGTRTIHRLNVQHDARIAAHHFSEPFPAIRRPLGHRPAAPAAPASRRLTGTWP
ncbi:hypothetical protein ACIGBL_15455 [Streptomyces sp. NPDC085614]|uniref:hypothetical protein n=1 Tax=unclassified Streptomyces TaxID=2593676 RepID=UPI0011CDDEC0|nr:hypothetical protein [Streptomyces sp. ms191]